MDGHALGEVVPSSLPLPSPVAVRSIASLMENVGGGEREAQNVTWEGFRQILAGRSGFGLGWGFGAGKTKRWRFFGLVFWLAGSRPQGFILRFFCCLPFY